MGYGNEFFVTLKSDECDKYFPDNNPTDFYCKLPYTLDLNGDWYVGVNQIWIDKMWYNMTGMEVQFTKNEGTIMEEESAVKIIKVSDGYYHDTASVVRMLNMICVLDELNLCSFSMDMYNGKMTLKVLEGYTMVMSSKLCDMLGMSSFIFTGEVIGEKCVNIHKYDGLLYIHTDIVCGYMYTNTKPDIIKTMSTNRYGFGDVIYNNFLADHTRVFMNCVDTIRIYITNGDSVIKQVGGCTVIQLHFRQG